MVFNFLVGGSVNVYGFDGVLGVMLVFYFCFGVFGGYGVGGLFYLFIGVNVVFIGFNVWSMWIGGFVGVSYVVENWFFNVDIFVICVDNCMDFDLGNMFVSVVWGLMLVLM